MDHLKAKITFRNLGNGTYVTLSLAVSHTLSFSLPLCIYPSISVIWGIVVAQWSGSGLQANRSSNQSFTQHMIHTKMHLISPGCPQPSLTVLQNCSLQHQSYLDPVSKEVLWSVCYSVHHCVWSHVHHSMSAGAGRDRAHRGGATQQKPRHQVQAIQGSHGHHVWCK